MTFNALGPRICILGPSNAGKSTLAEVIARATRRPCVHLDRLRHQPGTQWVLRSDADFAALHDVAIGEPEWVIDGNYSSLLPQRLARATGLIVLEVSTALSLWRYVQRCRGGGPRVGGIGAPRDPITWAMVKHIVGPSRRNRRRYARIYADSDLAKIYLKGSAAITAFHGCGGY